MKRHVLFIIVLTLFLGTIYMVTNKGVQASQFYNDEICYDERWDGNLYVEAAGKYIENANIPSKINGKTVTEVRDFSGCQNLKKVTIPNTVKEIDSYCFENCTSLTSVNIPSGVTVIEGATFKDCSSLTSISLPSSITKIKYDAFKNCKYLKNFTIPSKIDTLPSSLLEGCTSLSSITIPSNIKTIEQSAFKGCKSLKTITVPSTVTAMYGAWDEGIFQDCTSLTTANIYANYDSIPKSLFKGCTALTTVNLSNTFVNCQSNVFDGCKSLKKIDLPYKLKEIGSEMFANCTNLTVVNIPDTVEEVESSAFENCSNLTEIYLPVKTIYASYSYPTFGNCNKLKKVYFNKKIQNINENTFREVPNKLTIYGYSGTAAKSFAQSKGYTYIECTPASSIKISGPTSVIKTKSITLTATVSPSNTYNKKVKWTSSNDSIASVNYYSGVVTGKKAGTVTITAQATDGTGVKATYKVTVNPSDLPFKDVAIDDWFYNAVKYTYSNKMISGYNSTTFAPNDKVTRGMMVTILYKMEGSPAVSGNSKFSDVKSTEYYAKAVKWATDKGIVHGYGGTNKFGPNDNIIRQDLAGILRNYAKYKKKNVNVTADLTKFKDYKKVDSYANASVQWAVGKGVITGNTDGTLAPKGNATRAEAAATIQKYCNKVGR